MTFAMPTRASKFIVTFAAAMYGASVGAAPPLYRITIVPQPPLHPYACQAQALNDAGQVAGKCSNSGFLWSPATGSQLIDDPRVSDEQLDVTAINNAGVVAGSGYLPSTPRTAGFVWDAVNGFSYFGNESRSWQVSAVNDSNEVVGASYLRDEPPTFAWKAFRWSQAAGVEYLQPQQNKRTLAMDINNAGLIAGIYENLGVGVTRAALQDAGGATTTLLPAYRRSSVAYAVNGVGHAAGMVEMAGSSYHAFVWTPESGALDIDGRPNRLGDESQASDLNSASQAVGMMTWVDTQGNTKETAFYWDAANGMHDLMSLIDPTDPLRGQVTSLWGTGVRINTHGQIAVTGVDGSSAFFPLLLSPVP